jgi:hypothetical protein
MKSYTDLEQSKKLAKILPLESADMFLALNGTLPVMSKYIDDGFVTADDTAVPCWSLAALLKYLQKFRAQGYIPILFPTENKWILNFVERGHGTICKVACYDPVDTCVGTILTIVPILKLRGINIL